MTFSWHISVHEMMGEKSFSFTKKPTPWAWAYILLPCMGISITSLVKIPNGISDKKTLFFAPRIQNLRSLIVKYDSFYSPAQCSVHKMTLKSMLNFKSSYCSRCPTADLSFRVGHWAIMNRVCSHSDALSPVLPFVSGKWVTGTLPKRQVARATMVSWL